MKSKVSTDKTGRREKKPEKSKKEKPMAFDPPSDELIVCKRRGRSLM
jgi:hypothetical protein